MQPGVTTPWEIWDFMLARFGPCEKGENLDFWQAEVSYFEQGL